MQNKISFPLFLIKLFTGILGGAVGSLVLLFIFVLGSTLLSPITESFQSGGPISPIFIFLSLIMIFLATTGGNIVSSLLLGLTERERYNRTDSAIYQIFIAGIIAFILMAPVYFLTASVNPQFTIYAIALHIILTAQMSALILEIVSDTRYALIGVYGVIFSVIISSIIAFLLYNIVQEPTFMLLGALPIIWGSFAFTHTTIRMLYGWIADTYDKDFLAIETAYGNEYGKPVVEVKEKKAKDEPGAEFLRHGKE